MTYLHVRTARYVLALFVFVLLSCARNIPDVSPEPEEKQIRKDVSDQARIEERIKSLHSETQKTSSELDPKDSLSEEAYALFEKARLTSKDPVFFTFGGTSYKKAIEFLEQAIEVNPYYHAAWYYLGLSYVTTKQHQKAEVALLNSIELKPKYQLAYTTLAHLYSNQKRYEEALQYHNQALNIGPPRGEIFARVGEIYLAQGDFNKAEESYRKILDLEKTEPSDLEMLANFYLKNGKLEESWSYLKKARPFIFPDGALQKQIALYENYLQADNFFAFVSAGRIYYFSYKSKKAIEYLENAMRLNSSEFDQYYELGMAYKWEGTPKKAIHFLEKAVASNPRDYSANLELGLLYDISPVLVGFYEKNHGIRPNYERAIQLFRRAKEINPSVADPYNCLGRVYFHLKKYYDALAETKKALAIEKDSFTHEQLGDIYYAMKQYEMAKKAYVNAYYLDKRFSTIDSLTDMYMRLEEYDQAIRVLTDTIKGADYEVVKSSYETKLAEVYHKKKDYSHAIETYQEVLASRPDDFLAFFGIAQCYFDLKDWDTATTWWKKAVEINPKSSATYYNMGLAYENKEQYGKAISYFKKSLELDPDDKEVKVRIKACQMAIDRRKVPDTLRELSYKEGKVGVLANLLLCTLEYDKANNLWIEGVTETKYEDWQNVVSPKIYEAQGYVEKIRADLKKIGKKRGKIEECVNLFLFAVEQKIKGVEQHSAGYYKTKKEYTGECKKGFAKIKLADKYLADALEVMRGEVAKYESYFGEAVDRYLKHGIDYWKEIENQKAFTRMP